MNYRSQVNVEQRHFAVWTEVANRHSSHTDTGMPVTGMSAAEIAGGGTNGR